MSPRTGRPKKSGAATRQAILEAVRSGKTRAEAAEAAGVGRSTWLAWLAKGRAGDADLAAWAAEIDRAEKPRTAADDDDDGQQLLLRRAREAVEAAGEQPEDDILAQAIRCARAHLLPYVVFTYDGDREQYEVNWHHRLLAGELEDWGTGYNRRLAFSVPTRMGKSSLARPAVAWLLGKFPTGKALLGSYSKELAEEGSLSVKALVGSERHRLVFPEAALPTPKEAMDRGLKTKSLWWQLANGKGSVRATSIRGAVTGFPADWLVIDDPVKDSETAQSPAAQRKLWNAYTSAWRKRLQGRRCAAIVMTRWDLSDLIGRVVAQAKADRRADQWRYINLPDVLDCDPFPGDPRRPGEYIWPGFYRDWQIEPPGSVPIEVLIERALEEAAARQAANPHDYMCMDRGRPSPLEGNLVKRSWLTRRWKTEPTVSGEWVISMDLKGSGSQGAETSYCCLECWFRPHGTSECWLIDEDRGRWSSTEACERIAAFSRRWPKATRRLIEKKGYAPEVLKTFSGVLPLQVVNPSTDKEARFRATEPLWSSDPSCIILPDEGLRSWVGEWIEEVCSFPSGFTDRMDTATQALDRWKAPVVRRIAGTREGQWRADLGDEGSASGFGAM